MSQSEIQSPSEAVRESSESSESLHDESTSSSSSSSESQSTSSSESQSTSSSESQSERRVEDEQTDQTTVVLRGVYDKVRAAINKPRITAGDILGIASIAMVLVQKVTGLSGTQKKEMVVGVIKLIVDESGLVNDTDLPMVNIYIETLLPDAIEVLLDAYKNRRDFKPPSWLTKCCK